MPLSRRRARLLPEATLDSETWLLIRQALSGRSGGRCEVCGVDLGYRPWEAHHRRNKGMGGTTEPDRDVLSRLIVAHARCHAWCGAYPTLAEQRGLYVRHDVRRIADVPLVLPSGRRVLLDDNGFYLTAPPPAYASDVPLPSATWLQTSMSLA